jgi:hypothetical protein
VGYTEQAHRENAMSDEITNAVVAALKEAKVKDALASSVRTVIDDQVRTSLRDVVKGVMLGTHDATEEKARDPYRATLHFLAGLIAFSLAVIVGVFNALPDPPVDTTHAVHRMLGGVLGWMAITALIAAVAALVTQLLKTIYRTGVPWWVLLLLMAAPAVTGAAAVSYCIRGGAAMVNANAELSDLGDALRTLWPL